MTYLFLHVTLGIIAAFLTWYFSKETYSVATYTAIFIAWPFWVIVNVFIIGDTYKIRPRKDPPVQK